MIYIDGSYGEGGGQMLRTSLSLAAITGKAIRIEGIRARRPKPGLAAQHLTSVRAAAAICNAKVRGDAMGSMMLEFIPGASVQGGNYHFDVSEAREGGSAGAVTLILQTILLPLALAEEDSKIILRGGTHVAYSPPVNYIQEIYLPILTRMGIEANVRLNNWGWYPRGGGEISLQVTGNTKLTGINLLERGTLKQVCGWAVVTELESHIPQRMSSRAEKLLHESAIRCNIKAVRERGIAPGAGIFLTAEYTNSLAGFSALGRQGVRAEKVAEMAVQEFLDFHKTDAPVDVHLADQLLLPMSLAANQSEYQVSEISGHLTTNIWIIEQFNIAKISIDELEKLVSISPK